MKNPQIDLIDATHYAPISSKIVCQFFKDAQASVFLTINLFLNQNGVAYRSLTFERSQKHFVDSFSWNELQKLFAKISKFWSKAAKNIRRKRQWKRIASFFQDVREGI